MRESNRKILFVDAVARKCAVGLWEPGNWKMELVGELVLAWFKRCEYMAAGLKRGKGLANPQARLAAASW